MRFFSSFSFLATMLFSLTSPAAPPTAAPHSTHAPAAGPDRAPPPVLRDGRTAGAPPLIAYQSVFESYRKFAADATPEDWITVNARVQQRGGWREYAREAARANAVPAGDRK